MRVLQLIDSLKPGGAEKMAVNIANALSRRIDASFLCCTRAEGILRCQLSPEVNYLFLNKKNSLDPKAIIKLQKFVKHNRIDLIQAHSSSWFLGMLVKLCVPKLKLVWHDHYGRELSKRKIGILRPSSRYFDGIISVNQDLKTWAANNLYNSRIIYFKNFLPESSNYGKELQLQGGTTFKLVCVANLRPQKDHLNLLQAFQMVLENYPETTLHLVGREEKNSYSLKIKKFIEMNGLQEKVFIYGEQEYIGSILNRSNLGVLSSASEGLPLALLEYGKAGLPVVCTDVGQCKEVLGIEAGIVPFRNSKALAQAIINYMLNEEISKKDAAAFKKKVIEHFSEKVVVNHLISYFREIY